MRSEALRELFPPARIAERVRDIALRVNRDRRGGDLVALCVLKGAFVFFADLVRRLEGGPRVDFLRVASYGAGDAPSGGLSFTKDAEISLAGKDVLLVEDIVDSGATMAFLTREILSRGVNSLRTAALIDKVERRTVDARVDYAGFSLSSGFAVGYGLDYGERFRELPGIFLLDPQKLPPA